MSDIGVYNDILLKRGFSLVIIMILLFSFLAAYPLITRQVDNGQRLAETFERWTQLQVARDSTLQIIASAPIKLPATYSYIIGSNSSYTISLTGVALSSKSAVPAEAIASATAYVEHPSNLYNAGFKVSTINASFAYSFNDMATSTPGNASPASYIHWQESL